MNRLHVVRHTGLGLALLCAADAAFAHPGHAAAAAMGLWHWFTEPDHLLAMLVGAGLAGIAALVVGRLVKRGAA